MNLELVIAQQETNNTTESQRNSIISLKDESFADDINRHKIVSITEQSSSIKPIQNGLDLNGSKTENSVHFATQNGVQQNLTTVNKRIEQNKIEILQKVIEIEKTEEKEDNDDEQTYIKVPVRDLISTFERQTRPIIRYKLRDEYLLNKPKEMQREIDANNDNNKENDEPKSNYESSVNIENEKNVNTEKFEHYNNYEVNSELYNYSKSLASVTFSQKESQFSSISYNGIDTKSEQPCIIKPTPYKLNDVGAANVANEIEKNFEYENIEGKGKKRISIFYFVKPEPVNNKHK